MPFRASDDPKKPPAQSIGNPRERRCISPNELARGRERRDSIPKPVQDEQDPATLVERERCDGPNISASPSRTPMRRISLKFNESRVTTAWSPSSGAPAGMTQGSTAPSSAYRSSRPLAVTILETTGRLTTTIRLAAIVVDEVHGAPFNTAGLVCTHNGDARTRARGGGEDQVQGGYRHERQSKRAHGVTKVRRSSANICTLLVL